MVSIGSLRIFRDYVSRHAFAMGRAASGRERIGAEVEFLPIDAASGRLAPIEGEPGPATAPLLRSMAARYGWQELQSLKSGAPEFRLPNGGRISYEPGGQIEYASPPLHSVSALVEDLQRVMASLATTLQDVGVVPLYLGLDPSFAVEEVPLRLRGERYQRMDRYFGTLGKNGARMMRQTASMQIALDLGPHRFARWRLLNSIAPYLAAIFANSPAYEGRLTGMCSTRRAVWNDLDPTRTGLPWDREAVEAYSEFALGAPTFLEGPGEPPFLALGEHLERWGEFRTEACAAHLSTLFPEVRPRGYYEVRTVDALDPSWYAAPLSFLVGLVWQPAIAARALEITGDPDPALLRLAGERGLDDARLGSRAQELFLLALEGCASLSADVLRRSDLERTAEFFERFTAARRSPASEWRFAARDRPAAGSSVGTPMTVQDVGRP
ncbi:MAG TPA: glutamate-cysteine ligase family protein [Gemmatimonadaceae bacterium]|nr:glutamate-cysteine ligase family protein [Gemmatimonadaceae bacterium]